MLPNDPSRVDEYRKKMALAAKKKISSKHTLETKLKMSNSSIGKPKSISHRLSCHMKIVSQAIPRTLVVGRIETWS